MVSILFVACLLLASPAVASCASQGVDSLRSDCYLKGVAAYRAGDYAAAVKWWKKSAKDGDAMAQCNLGTCYASGKGVAQNYDKAFAWFRKSAVQGNAMAQYNVGNCYLEGYGVQPDACEAIRWYGLAAEQGNVMAMTLKEKRQKWLFRWVNFIKVLPSRKKASLAMGNLLSEECSAHPLLRR